MSSRNEQDQVRNLAARVASRLAEKTTGGSDESATAGQKETLGRELAALREGMTEIKGRLAHLETHVVGAEACEHESGVQQKSHEPRVQMSRAASGAAHWTNAAPRLTSSTYIPVNPPSEERFGINEAVSELADYFEQGKVCTLEPGGKPCDHCSMCSSRGF
ncbi:MAG: hypothetical protein M3407_12065 [Acidobacteriota bacterium]|nr:hypothetical protein [Acidobacteriota bacterium]